MAFTYIGISNIKNVSSDNECVLTPNASTDVGDIMFAFINSRSMDITTVPTGWTLLCQNTFDGAGQTAYSKIYYKVKTTSGTEGEYQWFFGTSGRILSYIVTFRGGFITTNPIDVVSNTQYQTSNTSIIAASMSVTKPNSPLLFFGSVFKVDGSLTFTKPSIPTTDWVENIDSGSATSDFWATVCSMLWTSSGTTGDITGTISASSIEKHAFAIALNPPVTDTSNMFLFF